MSSKSVCSGRLFSNGAMLRGVLQRGDGVVVLRSHHLSFIIHAARIIQCTGKVQSDNKCFMYPIEWSYCGIV